MRNSTALCQISWTSSLCQALKNFLFLYFLSFIIFLISVPGYTLVAQCDSALLATWDFDNCNENSFTYNEFTSILESSTCSLLETSIFYRDEGEHGCDIGYDDSGQSICVLFPGEIITTTIASSSHDSYQLSSGLNKPNNYESGTIRYKGFKFADLNIPAGVTITNAVLTLDGYSGGNVVAAVRAENTGIPSNYTNSNNYLSSRSTTSAFVNWSLPSLNDNVKINSPNLASVIQQVIDNNNGLVDLSLVLSNTTGTWISYNFDDGDASKFPQLLIDYEVDGTNSFVDDSPYALRTSVTLTPLNGQLACLSSLNFYEKAIEESECAPEVPSNPIDNGCCDENQPQGHDHPQLLVLEYIGSSTTTILFTDEENDDVFFNGTVSTGDWFSVDGSNHVDNHGKYGRLDTNTKFKIGNSSTQEVHTSCSQNINPGFGISSNGSIFENPTSSNSIFIIKGLAMANGCEEGVTNPEAGGYVDYPTKYGVRVTVGGQEIFKQIDMPTSENWSLEDIDFTAADFCYTSTTTFEIEILPYDFTNNGFADIWNVDQITVNGGCCSYCDNLISGGEIGYDQTICGISENPDAFQNITTPTGGSGDLEIIWMRTTDVNIPIEGWEVIIGATSLTFDEGSISQDMWYIRLARREGCEEYVGESNILHVTVKDNPILDVGQDVSVCNGQAVTLTASASGGTSPYTYTWPFGLGNGNSKTVSPSNTSIYVVTVTDAYGCTDTDDIQVAVNSLPTAEGVNGEICEGDGDGSVSVNPTSGQSPFQYFWSTGQNTQTISGLNPAITTDYTVIVVDANGCSTAATAILTVLEGPGGGQIGNDENQCGGYEAMLIVNIVDPSGEDCGGIEITGDDECDSGDKPVSFLLEYNGENCSSSNNDQGPIGDKWDCTGSGPNGNANVYISVNNGQFSGDVTLGQNFSVTNNGGQLTNPIEVSIYSSQGGSLLQYVEIHTSCSAAIVIGDQFGSLVLQAVAFNNGYEAGGSGGISNQWQKKNGNGEWTNIDGATELTYDPGYVSITTKFRRKTTNCCGSENSNVVTKTVSPAIFANAGPDEIVCADNSVTLTASTGLSNAYEGILLMANPESTSNSSIIFIKDGSDAARLEIFIAGQSNPTTVYANKKARIESDNTNHNHDDPKVGYGGGEYDRTLLDFDLSSISGSITQANLILKSESSGNLEVGVYPITQEWNSNNVTWDKAENNISWNTPGVFTSGDPLIASESVNGTGDVTWEVTSLVDAWINSSGGSGGSYSYAWSNGSNSQSITVSPNTTTTYVVTITDLASGCSDTDEATVEISNETLDPGTIESDQTKCYPFDPEIIESTMDATGECDNETYEDCCDDGDKPEAMTFKYNGENCGNSNNSQGTIGGKWDCNDSGSGPNGDVSVYIVTNDDFSGTVALNGEFTITNGGANLSNPVVISIYSSQGGSLLQEVEVHTSCSVPIVGGDQFGSMILMNTEFQNGISCSGISNNLFYQWQVLNSNGIWEDILNEVNSSYDPPFTNVNQTYRRLAINCCGESSSNEVHITIDESPILDAGEDMSICLGEDVTLNVTASGGEEPYTYSWPFGLGNGDSKTVNPASTTTYVVTVSDANGCTDTDDVTVTVNPNPTAEGVDGEICAGYTDGSVSVNPLGGQTPYSYLWSNGETTQTIFNLGPTTNTTYTVAVTDANYCSVESSATLTVNPNPTAEGVDGEICAGYTNGSVSVVPFDGQEPYSYVWSNGATTQTLINLGPAITTTYTVVVTDANYCSVEVSSILIVNPNPELELEGEQTICYGSSTTIIANATNGVAPYTYTIDGLDMQNGQAVVSPTSTTTYIVEATDVNGCYDTESITITVEPKAKVGDYTWNDTNFNGVQDLGENGINGVTVTLYNAITDELIESTTTITNGGEDGYYQFEVCKGDFYIIFGEVDNNERSPQDATNDNQDSDANVNDGRTDDFNLAAGENNQTVDAGYSPIVLMEKEVGSVTSNGNGSYTVEYFVTVTNTADGIATYSLKDTPLFDDDITINSGTYSGPANGNMNTNGSTVLATNAPILGNSTHIYTISFNVTLGLELGSIDGGDNVYTKCFGGAGNSGGFGPYQGLYNKAELDRNGDDITDIIDDACEDLPYLKVTKVASTPVAVGDGTYNISYTVTVNSLGGVGTTYDLNDTPKFDDDVIYNSGSYSGQNSGSMNLGSGSTTTLATSQSIGASPAMHTYTVSFNVELDLEDIIGDNEYNGCSLYCDPDPDGENEGLLNTASLTYDGITIRDCDCEELPSLKVTKVAGDAVALGDGTYDISYTVTVSSLGGIGTTYNLSDMPKFDDDVIINSGSYSGQNSGPMNLNNGVSTTLASNEAIGASAAQHLYTVTFNVTLNLEDIIGDNEYNGCSLYCDPDPDGENEGLLNTASLTYDGITIRDCDCEELPSLKVTKVAGDAVALGDGTYDISYTVTVSSLGGIGTTYDLSDTPSFDDDVIINSGSYSGQNSGFMNLTNGVPTTLATNQAIGASADEHTYTVIFNVRLDLDDDIGNNEYEPCDDVCEPEQGGNKGLLNSASLTYDGNADYDCGCIKLPYLEITKVASTPVALGDGTYDISYTVTVNSLGSIGTTYNLSDMPKFDDDVIINSGSYSGQNSGPMNLNNGVSTTLASNEAIGASAAQHLYTVTFNVTLNLEDIIGDNEYNGCSLYCDPDPDGENEGLLNTASLTYDGITIRDCDCEELPYIVLEKDFVNATPNEDGTYDVSYNIVVTNLGGVEGRYTLTDTPSFDDDVIINSGSYSGGLVCCGAFINTFNGNPGTITLIEDSPLSSGLTDVFSITFNVTLDLEEGSTDGGDNEYTPCDESSNGAEYTPGEGLYNLAELDRNADGTIDADDDACGDLPYVNMEKDFVSATSNVDGTYDVTYKITVTNTGGATGTYSLSDTPMFDDDVLINSGSYVGQSSGPLNTTGSTTLATGESIDAGGMQMYTLTFNVTLDLTEGSEGDNEYDPCTTPGDGPGSNPGEGLYNVANLDRGADGTNEVEDDACGDLPYIIMRKDLGDITSNANGTYNVNYIITVENIGGAAGTYGLTDSPMFDDDVTINAWDYTFVDVGAGIGNGPSFLGAPPSPIDFGVKTLTTGNTHIYNLGFNVTLDLEEGSTDGGDNEYTSCTDPGNGPGSNPGEGLYNVAHLDRGADGTNEIEDDACGDLPNVIMHKDAAGVTPNADGTYTVSYVITVENTGGATGTYSLIDSPMFDDDITIIAGGWITNQACCPSIAGDFVGNIESIEIASGVSIAAGATDTYTIDFLVSLDLEEGSTDEGDNEYTACSESGNGPGSNPGEGLYNLAELDRNSDGTIDAEDDACDDLPNIVLDKEFVSAVQLEDGTYDVTYSIDVTNTGGVTGTYSLTDTPDFDDDITINGGSYTGGLICCGAFIDTFVGDPGTITLIDNSPLGEGLTDVFTVTFNVTLDLEEGSNDGGDNIYNPCDETEDDSEGFPGEGLYNLAEVDRNSDGTIDVDDDACGDLPASLGDYVWLDSNADGLQDEEDTGIEGVIVNLLDENGDEIDSDVTDEFGYYLFVNLEPGIYEVEFEAPVGFETSPQNVNGGNADDNGDDSDADPITGLSGQIELTNGEAERGVDAGYYEKASLGDLVFFDSNGNGIQDDDENGVEGVSVNLLNGDGSPTGETTTTNEDGEYGFAGLDPGDYIVEFVITDGLELTLQDAAIPGADDTNDSDADQDSGRSHIVTLASGENNPTIDAGVFELLSLGNLVWIDTDNDGMKDDDENGVQFVDLALWLDMNGDDSPDVNTGRTAFTDANGFYLFEELVPGNYIVQVDPISLGAGGVLEGYSTSTGNGEPTDPDDDINNDDDGFDPGLGIGVISKTIELRSADEPINDGDLDVNSNLTVDFGFFDDAVIGNFVWNDVDADGIQDADDLGINGVTVNLYDANNPGSPIATTVTAESPDNATLQGYYLFEGLTPGDYFVEFSTPENNIVTLANMGLTDENDSDLDGANGPGTTVTVSLTSGDENLSLDAGFYQSAKVGNYVWVDDMSDPDGQDIQDGSDTGINGVTVNLYMTSDLNTPFLTMKTIDGPDGAAGYYLFEGIPSDDYVIEVVKPGTFSFVVPNVGNDNVDSDIVDFFMGRTLDFTVNPGDCIEDIDAGLRLPPLPVEWLYIRGEWLQDRDVNQISWATATEINSDYYIVERSYENEGFEDIGKVDSEGNSLSVSEYSFDDEDIDRNGKYYYRLRQVDLDGTIDYSDIVVITVDRKGDFKADVYPNPAFGFVNINIQTSELTDVHAIILDVAGKLVVDNVINGNIPVGNSEIRVPLENLPAGTYIVRITSGETVFNHKILVLNR